VDHLIKILSSKVALGLPGLAVASPAHGSAATTPTKFRGRTVARRKLLETWITRVLDPNDLSHETAILVVGSDPNLRFGDLHQLGR